MSGPDWIVANNEDDWNRTGCCFSGKCRYSATTGKNQGDLTLDQLGRQRRQLFVVPCRPSVLDNEIAAFYIAKLSQPLLKSV